MTEITIFSSREKVTKIFVKEMHKDIKTEKKKDFVGKIYEERKAVSFKVKK